MKANHRDTEGAERGNEAPAKVVEISSPSPAMDLAALLAEFHRRHVAMLEAAQQLSAALVAAARSAQADLPVSLVPMTPGESDALAKKIIGLVAGDYGLPCERILSRARERRLVEARHLAELLVRELTSLTLKEAGFLFGCRDHGAVLHGIAHARDMIATDRAVCARYHRLRVALLMKEAA